MCILKPLRALLHTLLHTVLAQHMLLHADHLHREDIACWDVYTWHAHVHVACTFARGMHMYTWHVHVHAACTCTRGMYMYTWHGCVPSRKQSSASGSSEDDSSRQQPSSSSRQSATPASRYQGCSSRGCLLYESTCGIQVDGLLPVPTLSFTPSRNVSAASARTTRLTISLRQVANNRIRLNSSFFFRF